LLPLGGFNWLDSIIPGVRYLDPERGTWKMLLLGYEDEQNNRQNEQDNRQALASRLSWWVETLRMPGSLQAITKARQAGLDQTDQLVKYNLKLALAQTRELERSYYTIQLFYDNAGPGRAENVSIVNASLEHLTDLDNPGFIDAIHEELRDKYDRLDLRESYSLLVIPGYLGQNKVVEKWARIAHEHKVLLLTDFLDFGPPDDVYRLFQKARLSGGAYELSSVVMTCNWLVGRARHPEADEEDALFVPPAAGLAGKLYAMSHKALYFSTGQK
jgi:hypothetical protein